LSMKVRAISVELGICEQKTIGFPNTAG